MYPGTSISGQTVMVPAYPPGSFPRYVSYVGNYPNQAVVSQFGGGAQVISSSPSHANQVILTDAVQLEQCKILQVLHTQTRNHHQHIKRGNNLFMHLKVINIM